MMATKVCRTCEKELDLELFGTDRKMTDGHSVHCKGCLAEKSIAYYYANHERRKASKNAYHKRNRWAALVRYGGDPPRCACCGEQTLEFLSIDHVNGGGRRHREAVTNGQGGWRMYAWLKKNGYPDGYRVLCHNCNQSYGFYGYCPHQQ